MVRSPVYLCARGSFAYMQSDGVFPVDSVEVLFQSFQPPVYPQAAARGKFVPYLSTLDLLLNVGPITALELIETQATKWLTWNDMVAACEPHPVADLEPCSEDA